MFTMLLQNFFAKNWPSDILFVGKINKYVIIMHLICINQNIIIINRFPPKKGRSDTLYMCLDIHAKFRGDRGPRSEGGVKLALKKPS